MNFLALVAAMTVALCNAQAGGVLDDGENFHLLMNKNFVPVSDEEDVLMKARFQQDCLIEETQDKFACREFLDGCGINVLNQAPDEGEEGGHSASRRARNCHFVLKKECEEHHVSSALCRAMFLQDSVSHLRTSSAVTTAMDDPFVKDVMITGQSYHGCEQTDEFEKYKCLGGKLKQGLGLVKNIAGGIASPDDLFNIAEGALELMGRLNPAVAAGLEIARMIFGSSAGGGEVDPEHLELLERFDELDKKVDQLAEAVGKTEIIVKTALCDDRIESMVSSLDNYQRAYDNILRAEKVEAIDEWEDTCRGRLGEKKIVDFMHDSINFLRDDVLGTSCAKDFYETETNKNYEGNYLFTFVQPLVQRFTQGMQLALDCPSVHDHNYEELQDKLTNELYEEFKVHLTNARNGWKVGAKAIVEDWGKSADAIRFDLERYSPPNFVYSVVKLVNENGMPNRFGYFESNMDSSISDNGGLFRARWSDAKGGSNVFIFYRKKYTFEDVSYSSSRSYGIAMPAWKSKAGSCRMDQPYDDIDGPKYMCSKVGGKHWFGNKYCVEQNHCQFNAHHLIREPLRKGNSSLQAALEKGSVLANHHSMLRYVSSSPHYELEMGYNFREGGAGTYQLFYPKHKPLMSNVALNKSASQSSTHGSEYSASIAVNGCTYSDDCPFSQTKEESDPWWKVDLGEITWVNSIQIFNIDFESRYLNKNIIVEVIDTTETEAGKVVYRKQYDEGDGNFGWRHIFGNINAEGDVVRVSLQGENRILGLEGVEVYSDY